VAELNKKTLDELRKLIRRGEVRTGDIVADIGAALEADAAHETPLNVYIDFDPELIGQRIEDYAAQGISLGETILGGVPIAVKDVINVKGTATTCGSNILRDYVSPYDATAITYMRREGGVPAGKLNMDEFAMGSSNENSAFGPVRNPHDRTRIPGGSSGGAASAVAADLAIAALASDTGGSIRQPASMCGVFGIKPTYGRVSRYGLVAYASSLDQIGVVSKTVLDGALLLEAITGHDPLDSTSASERVPRFSECAGAKVTDTRIGIPEEYFGEGLDEEVRTRIEEGIATLERAGAEFRRISLRHTRYAIATYYIIATAEASSNLARFDGIRYGTRYSKTDDLIELYRVNRSGGFGREVKRRILLGTFTLSSGYYDAYYLKAQKARTLIQQDFRDAFNEVDLIVTPVSPVAAWRVGELVDDPLQMYLADTYTVPVNLAGLPAASVPCGNTSAGLPVGLQIIAPHFREDAIIGAASALEEAFSAV
jgi:aspartyl-tRNA(Asn)/glutamyl-tRNA(Gln) amidotransferase subunit A